MKKLVIENVVIAASNLNPSLFSQMWLVRQGIIDENDILLNQIFTQFVTQISIPDFSLFVVPEQLQFTLTEKSKDNSELIKNKVSDIIKKIPHTPYKAIGTNFHWLVAPDVSLDFAEFTRKLFAKQDAPLYDKFSESNAKFGAYLSKDIFGSRLRLNIKPVKSIGKKKLEDASELLELVFNYHLDLTIDEDDTIDRMLKFLGQWDDMKIYSEEIASTVLL